MDKFGSPERTLPKPPPPLSGRTESDDEYDLRCEAAHVTARLYQGTGRSNQMFDTLRRVEDYLRYGIIEAR